MKTTNSGKKTKTKSKIMEGSFISFVHSRRDGIGFVVETLEGTVKAVYTDTLDMERKTTPITMLIVQLENGTFVHVPARNIHEIRLPEYFETVEPTFLPVKLVKSVEELLISRSTYSSEGVWIGAEGIKNDNDFRSFIGSLALEIVERLDKIV